MSYLSAGDTSLSHARPRAAIIFGKHAAWFCGSRHTTAVSETEGWKEKLKKLCRRARFNSKIYPISHVCAEPEVQKKFHNN